MRSILNRAFFTRLYVDAGRIIDHGMQEPFDLLTEAYAAYQIHQGRDDGNMGRRHTNPREQDSAVREWMINSLALTSGGQGLNTASQVGAAGFEPAAPRL